MSYVGAVISGEYEHPVGSTLYGVCETQANQVDKSVVLENFDALIQGVTVAVYFRYGNIAQNPRLAVGNTSPKNIYLNGVTVPGVTVETSWAPQTIMLFTYDGNYWRITGTGNMATLASNLRSELAAESATAAANLTAAVSGVRALCVKRKGSVSLPAASWAGSGPWTQTVTVSGTTVSADSIVDLQPDNTVFSHMYSVGVAAIYIANDNGTLTAYAVAKKPTANLTIQCTVTETVTEGS